MPQDKIYVFVLAHAVSLKHPNLKSNGKCTQSNIAVRDKMIKGMVLFFIQNKDIPQVI